jgi:hypothetical protein
VVPKAQVPVFYEITSANTNDIKVAKASIYPISVTLAFDARVTLRQADARRRARA